MYFHEWKNIRILIKISLKFVLKGPINNIPALAQIMAWRQPGDKPLSEPLMVRLLMHTCVTQPQWVKNNERIMVNPRPQILQGQCYIQSCNGTILHLLISVKYSTIVISHLHILPSVSYPITLPSFTDLISELSRQSTWITVLRQTGPLNILTLNVQGTELSWFN